MQPYHERPPLVRTSGNHPRESLDCGNHLLGGICGRHCEHRGELCVGTWGLWEGLSATSLEIKDKVLTISRLEEECHRRPEKYNLR